MTFDVEAAYNSWLNQRMRADKLSPPERSRMRIKSYTVYADFDLDDKAHLGDTFEIVGKARVVAIEEELVVHVGPRDDEMRAKPAPRSARVQIDVTRVLA